MQDSEKDKSKKIVGPREKKLLERIDADNIAILANQLDLKLPHQILLEMSNGISGKECELTGAKEEVQNREILQAAIALAAYTTHKPTVVTETTNKHEVLAVDVSPAIAQIKELLLQQQPITIIEGDAVEVEDDS